VNANQMDSAAALKVVQGVDMKPSKRLDAWVRQQRASQRTRRFRIGEFAVDLGVTERSLRLWRIGQSVPTPEHRAALERLTDGAVPASIWER